MFAAVVEHQAHLGATPAALAKLAGLDRAAQPQHLGGGLGEVDIHRVGLLDQRQLRDLALPDQRALGDQRTADGAGDRRPDLGVVDVEPRGGDRRLGGGDIGLRLLQRGLRRHPFGLADRLGRGQRLVARQIGLGLGQIGLGLGLRRQRAVERGAVGRVIDLNSA